MAIALRHMAMVSLMETGNPFNHDDPLHQDNIWEIEMLRMELQKKCDTLRKQWSDIHNLLNKSDCMGVGRPTHDNFNILSHEIFDTLSYSGGIEDSEIPWKEYFHVVYEFVVIDDVNYDVFEIKKHIDALNMCDSITPPSNDLPTQRTRYIDSLLKEYIRVHKEHYKNVDVSKMIGDYISKKSEYGRRLSDIRNELLPISNKLAIYNNLVEWSLH